MCGVMLGQVPKPLRTLIEAKGGSFFVYSQSFVTYSWAFLLKVRLGAQTPFPIANKEA